MLCTVEITAFVSQRDCKGRILCDAQSGRVEALRKAINYGIEDLEEVTEKSKKKTFHQTK